MTNIIWKSLIATPVLIGATLLLSTEVKANEDFNPRESFKAEEEQFLIAQEVSGQNDGLLNQLEQYSSEGGGNAQDQVTSVSQLRDVSPTEWAYEALRSLVERYGCIVGYPDRTFRGNRALSRYEFAAGLNACMQQMERLIASSEAVLREDIEKLKRLMKEFEAELAALGARVDNLEGRVAFLEDHQFSTTTKLAGEVIFALTQAFVDDNQAIFADRVRLELNTTFSGEDRLVTRLAAGNAGLFEARNETQLRSDGRPIETARYTSGSATLNQTFNVFPGEDNDVQIDWLAYYFPIDLNEDSRLNTYVAAFGGNWYDIVPTLNPYFEDYDGGNGALSTFASENPIYRVGGGSGAAVSYEVGFLEGLLGPTTATVGYLAGGSPNSPRQGDGLFNGDYAALGQLNANISDTVAIGFTYVHGFHKSNSAVFGAGLRDTFGLVGTPLANFNVNELNNTIATQSLLTPAPGNTIVVDAGDKTSNSYGAEFAWRITDGIQFNAFFTYTNLIANGRGNTDVWTYGGGFAFPDLGKEGSVLGIFAGVQPYAANSRLFLSEIDGAGNVVESARVRISNNTVPVHVEGFYKYQLTDNISLTPGVIWVSSPVQGRDSNGAVIGTLRGTFTF